MGILSFCHPGLLIGPRFFNPIYPGLLEEPKFFDLVYLAWLSFFLILAPRATNRSYVTKRQYPREYPHLYVLSNSSVTSDRFAWKVGPKTKAMAGSLDESNYISDRGECVIRCTCFETHINCPLKGDADLAREIEKIFGIEGDNERPRPKSTANVSVRRSRTKRSIKGHIIWYIIEFPSFLYI